MREQGGDLPLGRSVAHGHLLLFHSWSRAGTNARKVLEGSGMVFAAVFLPGRWGSCGRCRGVGMASEAHRTGGQDRVLVWAPWLVWETVLSALGLQALWGPCGGPAGVRGPWGGHGPRAVGALVRKPGHWRLRRLQRRRSCRPAWRVRWHRVLRLRFCFRTGTHGRSVLPALGRAVRRSQSSKASVSLRPPSRPPGHAGPGPSASLRLVGV